MGKSTMTFENLGKEIGVSKQACFSFYKNGCRKLFRKYKEKHGTSNIETLRRLVVGLKIYNVDDIKDFIKQLDDETKGSLLRESEKSGTSITDLFTN